MTQPVTLPSATAQKQAALEVFAQYEPPLYEAYLEMMLEWMAAVKAAMFTGGVARLGLVPDPLTVFAQTPKWAALTSQYTAQVAADVLAAPYRDLFADGSLFESRPFVRNWIAKRENRLSAVPGEVFGLVSQVIDSATVNGASIPDVTAQIEQLFGDTSVPKWKNRARTVARTEVVGAYNGGLHDAFTMIVGNDPGTEWMHRWLATDDQRTRPDHVDADGQLQPFGHPFTVGGFQMMHPHDPDGPPQEVINCRCVELLEIKNDATKMDNRQYLGASFNPAEKRARDGKWSKGGGIGSLGGWVDDTGGTQHFASSDTLREGHRKALNAYSGSGYMRVNEGLRLEATGESLRKTTGRESRSLIGDLDSAMKKAGGSKADAQLYRGTGGVSMARMMGTAWNDEGDNAGLEWTQASFLSTTQSRDAADKSFSGSGSAIMRIHVPKGTRGVGLGGVSRNAHEGEVLLDRGLRFRVTKDHGVNDRGRRLLDVEVVSGG